MATKKQLTWRKKFAALAKAGKLPRRKNPRPRIGTKNPKRKSSVTGRAPTKRLVKRRTKNTRNGYFPNPYPRFVVTDSKGKNLAEFVRKSDALAWAIAYAKKHRMPLRVVKV